MKFTADLQQPKRVAGPTEMTRLRLHRERHAVSRIGWLRAAVLGANDGIVSTASLIVGPADPSGSDVGRDVRDRRSHAIAHGPAGA